MLKHIKRKMKKPHIRKLALLYLFGSITFFIGLIAYPQFKIELYEGNMQSPFLIIGGIFFIIGSILGLRK